MIGALLGLLLHGMQRGRRDFASVRAMQPGRYEVEADAEVADQGAKLLDRPGSAAAGPTAAEK
ncbi:hypothetical protein [Streptomyces sioyaensis]|uniref:hypothetical protein n=1 Tax=Streptomyces sioyaensis TaxID=67364 RepID=UPI001F40D5B6|nr:hypothetical protein [Streptomyces sioyaensis]